MSLADTAAWTTWADLDPDKPAPCNTDCDLGQPCRRHAFRTLVFRLALAAGFDLMLLRLEELVELHHGITKPGFNASSFGIATTHALVCVGLFSDILTRHTRFHGYPEDRVSRLINSYCICMFYYMSWIMSAGMQAEPTDPESLKATSVAMLAVVRVLHRHPGVHIEFKGGLTAWAHPSVGPSRFVKPFLRRKKQDVLYSWIRFAIRQRDLRAVTSATLFCLALGLPLPSNPSLPQAWADVHLIVDVKERLDRMEASKHFVEQRQHQVEVCAGCGLYRSTKDQKTTQYKACAGCLLVT